MNDKLPDYLSEALNKLFDIASCIDFSESDAFLKLSQETSQLCLFYDSILDELQQSILVEQRTKLLVNAMLGKLS